METPAGPGWRNDTRKKSFLRAKIDRVQFDAVAVATC